MPSTVTRTPPARTPGLQSPARGSIRPMIVVWIAWVVLMAGVNLPTPLYAVYSERFGFSSAVLTAVFALYAFVLVPALMLLGQLSDRLGRRIVLLMGLAAGAAGLIVFALAESTAWLFAGRVFQGLAVGMASSAATAALVELEPARVALTAAVLWAAVALFLSIVPSYAATLLETSNLALLGAITAVMLAASCAAQVAAHHGITSGRAQQAGVILLALGLAGLVAASPLGSLPLLLVAAVLTGAGHGIGFLYAQDDLNRIAPPDRRGEVTAAFITAIYVGVAGSVISVGLLDTRVSLAVAVGIVAAVLAAVALAAGAWHRYGEATPRARAAGGR